MEPRVALLAYLLLSRLDRPAASCLTRVLHTMNEWTYHSRTLAVVKGEAGFPDVDPEIVMLAKRILQAFDRGDASNLVLTLRFFNERFQGDARAAEMSNAKFDGPWEFRQDVAYALRQAGEEGLAIGGQA